MNTQIYLWIEPMIINHQRNAEKVYFNFVITGNHTHLGTDELEEFVSGKCMSSIMDYAGIDSNWNYGVLSARTTTKKPSIQLIDSPEKIQRDAFEKKEKKRIKKIIHSKKPIVLTKDNISIQDGGKIAISVPELNVSQTIDFANLWVTLEKDVIGKIKKGDVVTMTDNDGNVLFELMGGNFLNVGLADMSIYDKKTMIPEERRSIFNHCQGLKGGLYVRDDGSIDVGDLDRTFYLKIYTNKLLKSSLKLDRSMNEIATVKLLNKGL